MKNYFKKFSIMFIMLLAVLSIGTIQNGNIANAATIGQQLIQPEDGWRRYDDSDSKIIYTGTLDTNANNNYYKGTFHMMSNDGKSEFYFTGDKLRIISYSSNTQEGMKINIDGISYGKFSTYRNSTGNITYYLLFETTSLTDGVHFVEITPSTTGKFILDAVDIDKDGYLIAPSLSLNKSDMTLIADESEQLTATTTPAGAQVNWSSSDKSVATVDENGNVTGVKEGQVTITATTTDGSNLSASCTVNVTNPIVPTITLNKTSDSLVVGQIDNLVATTTPAGATVNWTSSDSSIATVDSTGKVTALKEGQAVITATTTDGLTATCAVTVIPKTAEPTNPDPEPTDSEKIVNIAHAKGDNTNNAGGDVTIIFHGAAETTLSVIKTADVKDVWVGDNFTYTIVITNTGTKTAKAVVVNDPAPNHIDFSVNGVTTTQGTVDPSSTSKNIIVNVGDIAPGATVTIKIPATVVM